MTVFLDLTHTPFAPIAPLRPGNVECNCQIFLVAEDEGLIALQRGTLKVVRGVLNSSGWRSVKTVGLDIER